MNRNQPNDNPGAPQTAEGGQAQPSAAPPFDPRMLAAMYGLPEEDEIDLLEYWRILWKRKALILSISLLAAVVAAGISLTMPNIYKAEALLAPVSAGGSKGGGLSAALGGLGGLASLAGISMPGGGNVEENLAVLKSREFLWSFIKDEKLMPILFADAWDDAKHGWKEPDPDKQPTLWDGYRLFSESVLSASSDKKTGLITVAVEWKDPDIAAKWANTLVARLNRYLREKAIRQSHIKLKYLNDELARTAIEDQRKALFELISQEQKKAMLANTQKEFAFQVIDPAVTPDKKAKPKRSLIVILSTFVAGFLAVIGVFIQEGIRQRRLAEAENSSQPQPTK